MGVIRKTIDDLDTDRDGYLEYEDFKRIFWSLNEDKSDKDAELNLLIVKFKFNTKVKFIILSFIQWFSPSLPFSSNFEVVFAALEESLSCLGLFLI